MKLKSLQKIVAFLILMIGIVYIVLYIHTNLYSYHFNEGFQGATCPKATVGGRVTYICKSPEDANTLLLSRIETIPEDKIPICYTDEDDIYLNVENVEVSGVGNSSVDKTVVENRVFVCYDTGGEPQFDDTIGVYVPFDPLIHEDPLPSFGRQNTIINTASFKSGYNSFRGSYSNTSSITNSISTIGYASAKNVLSTIVDLSNRYCPATPAAGYITACAAIRNAYTNVNGYLTDTSPTSLTHINSVMAESSRQISNAYYNSFIPGFYNSHVMNESQTEEYIKSRPR